MGVADAGDVLGGGAEGHRSRRLADDVASGRTDDVDPQHPIGGCIGQDLHLADRVVDRPGPAVGAERKHPLAVLPPLGVELLFRLADGGDLRVGEHDRRHEVVIDMRVAGLHPLNTRDAILFRLVGEHRP